MRIVFMGTPEFAVPSLDLLADASEVVGVYTRPDGASGRGKALRPTPVKAAAHDRGLPVFQPHTLRDKAVQHELRALAADVLVVAAYGLILPPAVLESAPLGAVNVHASLLPRWRGAAPIQRAILAGDERVGVSIMRMEEGLDTGPYCLQVSTTAGDANAEELTARLADLGARALIDALPSIADGSAVWTEQDESLVTYADKVAKSDVAIAASLPVREGALRVRASSQTAPCRVSVAGRNVTLLEARVADPLGDGAPSPGAVAGAKQGVLLGMEDGALLVTRLKPEGKGAMAASDWARGVRDLDGSVWELPR